MLNSSNLVVLQGNLTRDAEYREDIGLVTLSLAVDYAGNEQDSDSNSGFFDVKMWVRDSEHSAASTVSNIKKSIADGRYMKGAKVSVIGKLTQDRWKNKETGANQQKVVINAENINVLWSADMKNASVKDSSSPSAPAESFAESF